MKLELENIEKIAKNIEKFNLSEITIESEGIKVTMKREVEQPQVLQQNVRYTSVPEMKIENTPVSTPVTTKKEEVVAGEKIVSPMMGTYYSAPSPESDAFVKVGSKIEVGDALCIVEAMKMMNEVKSEVAGTIVAIKASNGQVIKKGDELFIVK